MLPSSTAGAQLDSVAIPSASILCSETSSSKMIVLLVRRWVQSTTGYNFAAISARREAILVPDQKLDCLDYL